jgi:predicted nucleotidyltransferase
MGTLEKLRKNGIALNYSDVVSLCEKYYVTELSVFGSSIRDDFTPESDVDILVSFEKGADISLFDIMDMEKEISRLISRAAHVIEKEGLKNPIRREGILSTREIIYAT